MIFRNRNKQFNTIERDTTAQSTSTTLEFLKSLYSIDFCTLINIFDEMKNKKLISTSIFIYTFDIETEIKINVIIHICI